MDDRTFIAPTRILGGRGAFGVRRDVSVVLLDIEVWSVRDADQLFADTAGPPAKHSLIQYVRSDPGPEVRRRLAELHADLERNAPRIGESRYGLVTDSALMRGAITAWRWMTDANLRGFATTDVASAFEWMVETDAHTPELVRLYWDTLALLRDGSKTGGHRHALSA
ncbi:MAG: hypothetical protein AB8I08_19610 [Sandaracinaceae bacterium]